MTYKYKICMFVHEIKKKHIYWYNKNNLFKILVGEGINMVRISEKDIEKLQDILSRLYIKNGLTEEILLLSQVVDNIILEKQKSKVVNQLSKERKC